ncbi:MAG: hypothetical protein K8I27_01615 [Planctomycetes bacterium]|nr:hypothetical protein [Planctomycetota bacterium]
MSIEPEKHAPRVVEAEVVRDDEPHTRVEKVDVQRIPPGTVFGRSVFSFPADAEKADRRLKELRLKLWLYALGLMAIAGACFVGAFFTEVVFLAAFLIVAGLLTACAGGVVYVLLRAVRAISLPT